MKIELLDYGAGNVVSVERALLRLGAESHRASTPECISNADVLLLPGVGHYSALIRALDEHGLRTPLQEALARGIPFLGICLGLQALYETSEEAPELTGLHLLEGRVQSLPPKVKLPHMGWNQLQRQRESPLLDGIGTDAYFYFAHTFAVMDTDASTVATCMHGSSFVAVAEHKNIHAMQFHPEKSGEPGRRLLKNFLRLAA